MIQKSKHLQWNSIGRWILYTSEKDSMITGTPDFDRSLQSSDFFNAAQYHKMNCKAASFRKIIAGGFNLIRKLNIHGHAKLIKLKSDSGGLLKDLWSNTKAAFSRISVPLKVLELNSNVAFETGLSLSAIWLE